MGFFGGSSKKKGRSGDGLYAKAYRGLTEATRDLDVEQILKLAVDEATEVFEAERVGIAMLETQVSEGEGSWALVMVAGANKGTRITESDCDLMPSLTPGNFVVAGDAQTQEVQNRTIASSFRDDHMIGCQVFKGRIAMHRDPTPDNDLGGGKMTCMAIPLRYTYRGPIVQEKIKIGVLVLYNVGFFRYTLDCEQSWATHVARALALSTKHERDHQSQLFGEREIELAFFRQHNLFQLTKGKLKGGVVFGVIDNLTHYKKTVESETDFSPDTVAQFLGDIIRGTGRCLTARCLMFPLDKTEIYRAGVPGRVGNSGFVCVLPLLSEDELVRFARALQEDVRAYDFPAEALLESGHVTLSVRAMLYGEREEAEAQWNEVREELSRMAREQSNARGTDKLKTVTSTVKVRPMAEWMSYDEWREHRRQRRPAGPSPQQSARRPGGRR